MAERNPNPVKVKLLETIGRVVEAMVNIEDTTGQFLMPIPDGRVIDTKGWNDWEWTHGVGLYGLYKLHEITGDATAVQHALNWFSARFRIGTTKNVNTMSPLLTAALLHKQGKADFAYHLDAWAEWAMYDAERTEEGGIQHATYLAPHTQQLWDDTLMMTVLPLAVIGKVLNRPHYVGEAVRQALLHVKYLADPTTGLWFHGWTFAGRHHFAKARWARGNSWIAVAIPDLLELLALPSYDGVRIFLTQTLLSLLDALLKLQNANGMWHTLLDDPNSYVEASATAGFAYGYLKSVRMRLVPAEHAKAYAAAGKKAVEAVLQRITPQGELTEVSFGTPVFDDLDGYRKIPLTSMPYGQSLALLALTEYYRTLW
ncbi:glycoside hydrolase family 105 protein [Exidia glandulosa HHB12029]|uniref:Glycoside hydrolase family 105 protein n=1 Tax=Exidia glandulosa HHB12029 TaxID=1314781 RepID=A0A165B428_EXIGL|nr:glycoside hydrolase family 105 protein [Exidia glandulosa HHB12029]